MIEGLEPSWYSLLPPFITLMIAFATKQVVLALAAGIVTGGAVLLLQTGDMESSSIIENFLLPALASKSFASILLIYLWCLGGIIGMWEKTGGAHYFAHLLGRKIAKGPKTSLVLGWIVGLIFHQGGSISAVLAGTTLKPVTDQHRISHEELAYLVDSTASPVATIIPFNAWPLYIGSLVLGTVPFLDTNFSSYRFYLSCIPFNFYALCTVLCTLLFALDWLPWIGSDMKKARIRARTTGQLDAPTARPLLQTDNQSLKVASYNPSLLDFIIPISLLLGVTIVPFMLWRLNLVGEQNANWINAGFLIAAVSSMVLAYCRGMSLDDVIDGFTEGCKAMTMGAIILGLAITIGVVTQKLGTAEFLIQISQNALSPIILPGLLTVLCMIVAFATGTSFGTYAVVFPVALPLAYSLLADPFYIQICFGAVLGGALFGDQCSPVSDTTILSSMFTGCDLMDHVRTQLPLAFTTAILSIILSTSLVFIVF